ncbi:MAG: substrate-binding domain-containing protein [Kiritimatiellae bacterium]|nr:substrate-binding domain-containing protein [Kiritimatiellia bacterium]
MRSGTKCRTIVDTLSDEIAAGCYRPPTTFPSAERIVRRFKVSYSTAVKALDEMKKRGLVYSVIGSGTFVTKTAGRSIGLLAPAWSGSDFFPTLCHAVSATCQSRARPLLFVDTSSDSNEGLGEKFVSLAESLVSERVSGILCHPVDFSENASAANEAVLGVFRKADVPVVLLDCDIVPPPGESGYDVVGIDNVAAGWRLGEHVLSRGARRVLFVSMFANISSNVQSRLAGLRNAVAEVRGARVDAFDMPSGNGDVTALADCLKGKRPDAVVCSSDNVAAVALKALRAIGKSVPGDVLVTGVNDTSIATLTDPPLTTIRQPCADIARVAFEALDRRRRTPDAPPMRVFLPAPLIERESTFSPTTPKKKKEKRK